MYRTALVTGASSGIGRALCIWLAQREVRVWACARNQEALDALAAQHPSLIVPHVLDVSGAVDDVTRVIQRIDDDAEGLDLVVANAAIAPATPASTSSIADVARVIDTNARGASVTLLALVDRMVARGEGHLVGISSLSDARGVPRYSAYAASKAFFTTFLEGLRVELATTCASITVTTVRPGFVKTEGTKANVDAGMAMPFLLELDDAVERIGDALLARETEVAFPAPAVAATVVGRVLPSAVWERAVRRLTTSPAPTSTERAPRPGGHGGQESG